MARLVFVALALCGLSTVSATSPSPSAPPSAPPPPPPPPPPLCASQCVLFYDGYTASSPVSGCYKVEGSNTVCRPGRTDEYGIFTCPQDHTICGAFSQSGFYPPPPSPPPASCTDRKPPKCAKKVAKNKCSKRSSQKKCRLSCNYCTVTG